MVIFNSYVKLPEGFPDVPRKSGPQNMSLAIWDPLGQVESRLQDGYDSRKAAEPLRCCWENLCCLIYI